VETVDCEIEIAWQKRKAVEAQAGAVFAQVANTARMNVL